LKPPEKPDKMKTIFSLYIAADTCQAKYSAFKQQVTAKGVLNTILLTGFINNPSFEVSEVDAGRTGMSATRDQALPVSSPEDGHPARSTIGVFNRSKLGLNKISEVWQTSEVWNTGDLGVPFF
jgi:hypothetical protein